MTKTELKHEMQDRLMSAMRVEYSNYVEELGDESPDKVDAKKTIETCSKIAEMQHQMDRVAKLFGYESFGSYGC